MAGMSGFINNPFRPPIGLPAIPGLDGTTIAFNPSSDDHAENWMRTNLQQFGNYKLKELLWLPGSHDAGMYKGEGLTTFSKVGHVITQKLPIWLQLRSGIRWFDIRPSISPSGHWYCGHYTMDDRIGWQGGYGQAIDHVIGDISSFLNDHQELVVLNIARVLRTYDGSASTVDEKKGLLRQFVVGLAPYLYGGPFSANSIDVTQKTLNELIGRKGCVVLHFTESKTDDWKNLFQPQVFQDASLTRTEYEIDSVDLTVPSSTAQSIGAIFLDSYSILSLAAAIPGSKYSWLPQEMATKVVTAITQPGNPKVAQFDAIDNGDPLTFTLAASFAGLLLQQPQQFSQPCVVVYGGRRITNSGILDAIYKVAMTFGKYSVTNASMGGDTWPYVVKSCVVYVRRQRYQYYPNEPPRYYLQARYAKEGGDLDFGTDINRLGWSFKEGPTSGVREKVFTDPDFGKTYEILTRCIIEGKYFSFNFGTPSSVDETTGQKDPASGVLKSLIIQYRSLGSQCLKLRRVTERETENFWTDIEYIKYEGVLVADYPWVYEPFFVGLAKGNSIVVNNTTMGKDTFEGRAKTATMKYQYYDKGIQRYEVSCKEGSTWTISKVTPSNTEIWVPV